MFQFTKLISVFIFHLNIFINLSINKAKGKMPIFKFFTSAKIYDFKNYKNVKR